MSCGTHLPLIDIIVNRVDPIHAVDALLAPNSSRKTTIHIPAEYIEPNNMEFINDAKRITNDCIRAGLLSLRAMTKSLSVRQLLQLYYI